MKSLVRDADMLRYSRGELYRLKHRSGHARRPEAKVLDSLAAAGVLRYRGRRAGRNMQRQIEVIDRSVGHRVMRGRHRLRRGPSRQLGCNVNNLVRPRLMRHVFRPTSTIACGTLNVRSLRNKVDAVSDLMRDEGLDVLGVTESWHEGPSCVCIARLRSLGYNVIEEARPIPEGARTDSIDFINHGGW